MFLGTLRSPPVDPFHPLRRGAIKPLGRSMSGTACAQGGGGIRIIEIFEVTEAPAPRTEGTMDRGKLESRI